MSVPVELSIAANCLLTACIVSKREKHASLWLIQGSTLLGTGFLIWECAHCDAATFDNRLALTHLFEFCAEFAALGWLLGRTRGLQKATHPEYALAFAIVLHLNARLVEWTGWGVDAGLNESLLTAGNCANLLLIVAMAWVVFSKESEHGAQMQS